MAYFGQLLNPNIFWRSALTVSGPVILHLASACLIIPVLFPYLCSMPTSWNFVPTVSALVYPICSIFLLVVLAEWAVQDDKRRCRKVGSSLTRTRSLLRI
jgi:hypothetical protein